MIWHVEVREKTGIYDAIGSGIEKDIRDLGIDSVDSVKFVQVYILEGDLSSQEVDYIARELLVDNVTQEYSLSPSRYDSRNYHVVEIAHNPGVMDPIEGSVIKGIRDLGIKGLNSVRTAKKYIIKGRLGKKEISTICGKLLYNKLIQHIVVSSPYKSTPGMIDTEGSSYQFKLIKVDILRASRGQLKKISKKGQLFLNVSEMLEIQRYFKRLKRNPTDCELETIAQTWSEHCWHKTFRGDIDYQEIIPGKRKKRKFIRNLLKATIMKATKELNKPWCISVFKDNSGVIKFDENHNVCFKVETHNHPSALEPFGGANTGIGGVIRDPLGTGLGARPILNTDVFCFAPPDFSFRRLPAGVLHPKRIMKGVVSGVRDYGNKMGIPTVNGAVLFHERFVGNPLVYCGTAGIMPKDKTFKEPKSGDLVVVVGGRTGRDGIHGATFSSGELTHESEKISSGAVQIGNPIQEKKMVDTILKARDLSLYSAITDCGAGGLSSAVGEMGEGLGVRVDLERVPRKYSGLSYTEIWISESQERMVLAVPRNNIGRLMEIFNSEDVEATVIGEFTDSRKLKLYYDDKLVCDLDMEFLHKGIPRIKKKAVYIFKKNRETNMPLKGDLGSVLLKLLSRYDICSKEWIIRQYDHEVQGGSVLKPLVGINNSGPSDASIVRPLLGSKKGIIVSNGINFRYGFIDPYWMAASCIDEALRQIIAVGGSLKEVALLDNFCWGNPDKPDRLGSLVRAAYGCYDIAKAMGVPFISGKDSLNNEYTINKKSISIPGTLLISAIAVMDDVNSAVSMYAKKPGNLVYIVGRTYDEMGSSHYYDLFNTRGNSVPKVYPKDARRIFDSLSRATRLKLVEAMHDCSEGGMGVALAEMAFSGELGMQIFLSEVPFAKRIVSRSQNGLRNDTILFSESNSRFIAEVSKEKQKDFEALLRSKDVPFGLIGCLSKTEEFKVYGLDSKLCINTEIGKLKEAWQKPLRW